MKTLSELKSRYDEIYYERGVESGVSGYSNYRWMPELTIPMAMTVIDTLGIRRNQSVLDFGCAKGFVVRALRMLRRDAWGVDISPYAIEQADPSVMQHVHLVEDLRRWSGPARFDFALAKDVLEHVPYEVMDETIGSIAERAGTLMVVVPLGDGQRYTIEAYERDVTHIVREPAGWWADRLRAHFSTVSWTYKVEGIKDNWRMVHPEGNAILIASHTRAAA